MVDTVGVKEYIADLERAVRDQKLSYSVMMPAIENLNSSNDMRDYFEAYKKLTQECVERDSKKGYTDLIVVQRIQNEVPLEKAVIDLALDRFRHLINHYSDPEIHKKWNEAIPGLGTAGGLASIC